jgi:maltose alpha-D-glucosyltransferase/alpha-amylase
MPALLVGAAWETLLEGNVRTLIERDLLMPFLQRQRWFGGKARAMRQARFSDWGMLRRSPQPLFLTLVDVEYVDGGRDQYFLPLTVCTRGEARPIEEHAAHGILANITGAKKGFLFDGWLDDRFARTLLDAMAREEAVSTKRGTIRAVKTAAFAGLHGATGNDWKVRRMSAEQSNSSIVYGNQLILKLFRRLEPGINPDFEIGRQLTEHAQFTRVPAVAGAFEYTGPGEAPATIGMMQQLVKSQGDGWSHALNEVVRYYDEVGAEPAPSTRLARTFNELIDRPPTPLVAHAIGGYLENAATLGRRTAEMHVALASDSSHQAFAPEPFTKSDLEFVAADALIQAQKALDTLAKTVDQLPPDVSRSGVMLLNARETLLDHIQSAPALEFAASKIRVHGDYHLGQVLWSEQDFYVLDFEGEPARPLEERRSKQSPLKDVAGMVRSFGYAAYAGLFAATASRRWDFERMEPWARIWQTSATGAFLREYFTATAGALFIPAAPSQREALLQLFVLDKALYELNYELNNRPDWVRIPLYGIVDLLPAAH